MYVDLLFLIDLHSEICNFADDNTIYARSKTLEEVIQYVENDLSSILQWFTENGMVANPEKFQLMFLGLNSDQQMCLSIDVFFHTANKEINRTHKRALRVLHKDYDASFDMCLMREADTTIHIKNLQKLMVEVFKL